MGQGQSGSLNKHGLPGDRNKDGEKKDKKFEPPPAPSRVGRKQRKQKGSEAAARLPVVTPLTKCKLRLLKMERIKDYLLMEEEFVSNQERLKPQEDKNEEDRSKVDDLRGSPMSVGSLEELIDENHAIVSSSVGPEYYVGILSFVDKDQLEPGCAILMHNKVLSVVGLLQDDVDPMVSVMKVEKAPLESYADIGGLDAQIQEIKEAVELPLTHPELYEDIGIKPPKGVILYGEPGTGKTLLAKAVANSTSATFLRVVGSELIQKYLGDGPKLVREFAVEDSRMDALRLTNEDFRKGVSFPDKSNSRTEYLEISKLPSTDSLFEQIPSSLPEEERTKKKTGGKREKVWELGRKMSDKFEEKRRHSLDNVPSESRRTSSSSVDETITDNGCSIVEDSKNVPHLIDNFQKGSSKTEHLEPCKSPTTGGTPEQIPNSPMWKMKRKTSGRKEKIWDLGRKMSDKLDEKRRHIEEKGRHIVEKFSTPIETKP